MSWTKGDNCSCFWHFSYDFILFSSGHCWRSKDKLISDVLLWTPTYGRAKAGRPARTYIQQLCEDTRCIPEDLPVAMNDRENGDYYKPRKARFIPTFCKRINRTQPAVEIWVRAFEERKTNDLYMQQNLYTTTTTTINRVLHQME